MGATKHPLDARGDRTSTLLLDTVGTSTIESLQPDDEGVGQRDGFKGSQRFRSVERCHLQSARASGRRPRGRPSCVPVRQRGSCRECRVPVMERRGRKLASFAFQGWRSPQGPAVRIPLGRPLISPRCFRESSSRTGVIYFQLSTPQL